MNNLITFLTTTGKLPLALARKIQRAMLILALGIIAIVFASIVLSSVFGEGAIIGGLLLVCLIFILLWAGIITPELLLGVFVISLPSGSGAAKRVAAILGRLYEVLLAIVTFLGVFPLMLLFVAKPGDNVQGAIVAYIIGGGIGILVLKKGSPGTIALNLGLSIGIGYVIAFVLTPAYIPFGWVLYPAIAFVFCLFENIKLTGGKMLGLFLLGLVWYGLLWLVHPKVTQSIGTKIDERLGWEWPSSATPLPPERMEPEAPASVTAGQDNQEGGIVSAQVNRPTNTSGCKHKIKEMSFKPEYNKPASFGMIQPGTYLVKTEAVNRKQWFVENETETLRGMGPDGVMNSHGNEGKVWRSHHTNTPFPEEVYGIVYAITDVGSTLVGESRRVVLQNPTEIWLGINIFQTERAYKKSEGGFRSTLYRCN